MESVNLNSLEQRMNWNMDKEKKDKQFCTLKCFFILWKIHRQMTDNYKSY